MDEIGSYLELKVETVISRLISLNNSVYGPESAADAVKDLLEDKRDNLKMYEESFLDIGIIRMPDIDEPKIVASPLSTSTVDHPLLTYL